MGAFLLIEEPQRLGDGSPLQRGLDAFEQMGFVAPRYIDLADYGLWLFPKLGQTAISYLDCGGGDFVCVIGTLFCRGKHNGEVLREVYDVFQGGVDLPASFRGAFHLILRKRGAIYLLNDVAGVLPVYITADRRVFSSSWLPICRLVGSLTLSTQNAYEYVFNGSVLGNGTLVREIDLLPLNSWVECRPGAGKLVTKAPTIPVPPRASREELLEESLRLLRGYFRDLVAAFPAGFNCALSGGYDSRLILGLLQEQGARPGLFVYGGDADDDVRIAKAITDGEGLGLRHIDRSRRDRFSPEVFAEQVRRNFNGCDGYSYGGLLNWDSEYTEIRRRTGDGRAYLNGGGGEVFRNFFYLPNRSFTARQLLWSFYGQFEPRWATARFDEEAHFAALEAKVAETCGNANPVLERHVIEWLYPNFRCRSWVAKEMQFGNRAGIHLNPFLDHEISQLAASVSVDLKDLGHFEAELIRRVSPRLAVYPSAYGHAFTASPTWSYRAAYGLSKWRSPWLRCMMFRLRARTQRHRPPVQGYGAPVYLHAVFGDQPYVMEKFFRLERVRSEAQRQRIWALEYLCRELSLD